MKVEGRMIYADPGKVLDFKEPQYALDDEHTPIQVHLYTPKLRMGLMDSPDRYIEVDKNGHHD